MTLHLRRKFLQGYERLFKPDDPLRKVGKEGTLSGGTYFSKHRRPSRPLTAVIDFVCHPCIVAPINSIEMYCAHKGRSRVHNLSQDDTSYITQRLLRAYRTRWILLHTHINLRDLDESFVRCNRNKDAYHRRVSGKQMHLRFITFWMEQPLFTYAYKYE